MGNAWQKDENIKMKYVIKVKKTILMFLSVVLLALSFSSCSKDENDNNKPAEKRLEKITVKEYEWKFGEKSTYGELYEESIYDENGNLVKFVENHYNSAIHGRLMETTTYTYDSQNRLIQENQNGLSKYVYKYQYNAQDLLIAKQEYNDKGALTEEYKYEYDSQKRKTKEIEILSSMTNFGYVRTYTYSGNKVIEVTKMLSDGSPFGTMEWEYDTHNNMLSETWTNDEKKKTTVQKKYTYIYDDNGRMKQSIYNDYPDYPALATIKVQDFNYDEQGKISLVHVSYQNKNDQSDLEYTYSYR